MELEKARQKMIERFRIYNGCLQLNHNGYFEVSNLNETAYSYIYGEMRRNECIDLLSSSSRIDWEHAWRNPGNPPRLHKISGRLDIDAFLAEQNSKEDAS